MKNRKEITASLIFIFFAGVVIIASFKASIGRFSNPGPGLLPFLAALLLGFFSLCNLIVNAKEKSADKGKAIFSANINRKNLIASLAALLVFPSSISFFGFSFTVFGFLLMMLKIVGEKEWGKSILVALIATFFCHFLFVYWLGLNFEEGIFGI